MRPPQGTLEMASGPGGNGLGHRDSSLDCLGAVAYCPLGAVPRLPPPVGLCEDPHPLGKKMSHNLGRGAQINWASQVAQW